MTTPASTVSAVSAALCRINPATGQQTALIQAMQTASDAIASIGGVAPVSAGARILDSRDAVNAASAGAIAAGEPGNYVASHDGRVYTPEQMMLTLHRQLIALGYASTAIAPATSTPDPSPNISGRAGVLMWPDISTYQTGINVLTIKNLGTAAIVMKIGQGAGHTTETTPAQTYGQTIDPLWLNAATMVRSIYGLLFAGYWYVGQDESPTSQAARCLAALGDTSIPVMLDWEDGSGEWSNLLAVLRAFQAAGINVSMLYYPYGYESRHGASNIDALGLSIVRKRYYDDAHLSPATLYAELPASYWAAAAGGTPAALQFSRHAAVPGYSGDLDFNVFRGSMDQLAALFQGGTATSAPSTVVPPGATPPLIPPASWRAGLDHGWGFAHQSTPWNREPQSLPLPQIVDMSRQQFPGSRVGWAFAAYLPGGAKRIEQQPNISEFTEGNQAWFGFSFILSRNFPISKSFWHVICQLKNDGDGSPPVSLQVKNGHLVLTGGYGHPTRPAEYDVNACTLAPLTWYDVQFRVRFSRFQTAGSVDVWVNGKPCITGYQPATGTLYPTDASNTASQSSYLKYGLYRDPGCPIDATVYHAGWAVGAQHGSVMLPASG